MPQPSQSLVPISLPETTFDRTGLMDAIGHLRYYGQRLAESDADANIRASVELCIQKLLKLSDSLDPIHVWKATKHLEGRVEIPAVQKGPIAYRVCFMLKAFLYADLLGSDKHMGKALERAIGLVIPDQSVSQPFVDLLWSSSAASPSPASISRWRVLIDGALMQVERDIMDRTYAEGLRFARYLQALQSEARIYIYIYIYCVLIYFSIHIFCLYLIISK